MAVIPGGNARPLNDLTIIFDNVVGVLLGFAAIGLFIMLLVGGFKYIFSGGDPKAAEGAKKTVTFGLFGMILIACAYLIIQVIGTFTGVNSITNFAIFKP
jgi:hypothetical protein